MNRTIKLYILLLVLIVVGVVFVEANRPKPINWTPTYSVRDKIPFGLYVFNKESKYLFNGKAEQITITPYEFLTGITYSFDEYEYLYEDTVQEEEDGYMYESDYEYYTEEDYPITDDVKGNFISIRNWIDEQSIKQLIKFASEGNTVFLSSDGFSSKLLDTLKLETDFYSFSYKRDSIRVYLSNQKYINQKYNITVGSSEMYFSKIDTLNTVVLGYQHKDSLKEKDVNFVKVLFGKGSFYLHLQPAIFTNYHLLKNKNYELTENVLSYLPKNQKIYWYTKGQTGETVNQSPLRYWTTQLGLKEAWYLLLITGIVFLIFNAKRKQRIVPIIKPLENTTVDFTKTIGNLYFQEKDHNTIIDKKITYFLEKIRTQYLMETNLLDEQFIDRLQLKSGKKTEDIERVVNLIEKYRKYGSASEKDLIELNKAIEKIS